MAIITFDRCIGCRWCKDECPTNAIRVVDGYINYQYSGSYVFIDEYECIECGACAIVCPTQAIMDSNSNPITGGGDDSDGGGPNPMDPNSPSGTSIPYNFTAHPVYVALSNLVGSLDMSANFATASAHFMGTTLPRAFVNTGLGLTIASVTDNVIQIYDQGWNTVDASQVVAGVVLIAFGFMAAAPVAVPVVLIGGIGLFIWEQAEGYYGW